MNVSEIDNLSINDARNLIAELQEFVTEQEKLSPDGIRAMLENLPNDIANAIDEAINECAQTIDNAIEEYVESRCDDEALEAYENGDFENAIYDARLDAVQDNDWCY